ncbi:MAG TPA: hypothetical protein VJ806_02145 [Luteimonas sp.]|nr:hypothetical protein [Luteimonas sp.]
MGASRIYGIREILAANEHETTPHSLAPGVACLVGMLLAEGFWDALFFAMAATPLAWGGARRIALSKQAHRPTGASNKPR